MTMFAGGFAPAGAAGRAGRRVRRRDKRPAGDRSDGDARKVEQA